MIHLWEVPFLPSSRFSEKREKESNWVTTIRVHPIKTYQEIRSLWGLFLGAIFDAESWVFFLFWSKLLFVSLQEKMGWFSFGCKRKTKKHRLHQVMLHEAQRNRGTSCKFTSPDDLSSTSPRGDDEPEAFLLGDMCCFRKFCWYSVS